MVVHLVQGPGMGTCMCGTCAVPKAWLLAWQAPPWPCVLCCPSRYPLDSETSREQNGVLQAGLQASYACPALGLGEQQGIRCADMRICDPWHGLVHAGLSPRAIADLEAWGGMPVQQSSLLLLVLKAGT